MIEGRKGIKHLTIKCPLQKRKRKQPLILVILGGQIFIWEHSGVELSSDYEILKKTLLLEIRGKKTLIFAPFRCTTERAMTFWLFAVPFLARGFCNSLTRRTVSLIYYLVSFCMRTPEGGFSPDTLFSSSILRNVQLRIQTEIDCRTTV